MSMMLYDPSGPSNSGDRKITSKQIGFLVAKAVTFGINCGKASDGYPLLMDFIEFDCDIKVAKIGDLTMKQMDRILEIMENLEDKG